jgi:hypothetical protein
MKSCLLEYVTTIQDGDFEKLIKELEARLNGIHIDRFSTIEGWLAKISMEYPWLGRVNFQGLEKPANYFPRLGKRRTFLSRPVWYGVRGQGTSDYGGKFSIGGGLPANRRSAGGD